MRLIGLFYVCSGVAIGSSIGHAVGSFFTGGSSSAAPAETQQAAAAQPMDNSLYQANSTSGWAEDAPCAADARSFRKCMDDNRGDLTICGWYMDQLVRSNNLGVYTYWENMTNFSIESLPAGC